MTINEREIVLDMLLSLEKGGLSHKILKDGLDNLLYLEKSHRAFISRLFEGSIEKRIYLDYVINLFSKTAVNKMKPLIRSLLRLSTYQILFMDRVPDSAAINEAVKLAKKRGFSSLSGFVNGVLRNIGREKESIALPDTNKERRSYLSVLYSMPEFLIDLFLDAYDEEAEPILRAFNEEKSLILRVNERKTTREQLLKRLEVEGVKAEASNLPLSIKIVGMDSFSFLESFEEGDFWLQDESSQMVGELSGVNRNDEVFDLCAAPGGKSFCLANQALQGRVVAMDLTDSKLSLIHDNIARLGMENVEVLANDALVFREEWIGMADLVLCDLPCSGLGVMGRKKDIKYHISMEKIKELSEIQKKILTNAIQYVKPGGCLIFSTCTMTKEENEENFTFLAEREEIEPLPFSDFLPDFLKGLSVYERYLREASKGYLRILPTDFGSDGFFISKFIRKK